MISPSRIPVEMGGVSRIRVGEHYDQNKLRFVLDLDGENVPPYALESVGSDLVLRLGEGAMAAAPAEPMAEEAVMVEVAPEPAETLMAEAGSYTVSVSARHPTRSACGSAAGASSSPTVQRAC